MAGARNIGIRPSLIADETSENEGENFPESFLTLEESDSFNPGDLESPEYYVVGSQGGFLVFEYSSEDGPGLAFVQHELSTEDLSKAAIGNWPRTESPSGRGCICYGTRAMSTQSVGI